MQNYQIGDKVIWDADRADVGVIKGFCSEKMQIQWSRAGLLSYSKQHWDRVTVVEKNNTEFKTIQVVKIEDYTGTVVEYKGRKYKLTLVK